MDYYKRYMGDYGRDTGHLSIEQHGAYILLLDHYYSRGKPLMASIPALCRLCRAVTKSEQLSVTAVVEEFFPLAADGLRHNKRADEELAKWEELSSQASEAGKRGAQKRWGPNSGGNNLRHSEGYSGGDNRRHSQRSSERSSGEHGEKIALQLHSQKPSPDPEPKATPEPELETRARASPHSRKPVSAAELLASSQNGKHAAEGESPESAEAATLRRVVLDQLSRGASPDAIIRLMPGRGLTEEQIAAIAREAAP